MAAAASTSSGLIALATLSACFAASSPAPPAGRIPESAPQYRIKLATFVAPPIRTVGLMVIGRVNSGPPLRLLVDSGAQYVVLDRRSAMRSGCSGGKDLDMIGVGSPSAAVVKTLQAETIQLGELTLRDVPLVIEDRTLGDGIQGVVPLSIFAGFLIRLDIPGKTLDLLPYPAGRDSPEGALPSVASNGVLFVKGRVNDEREGYFLLDTGASYTAISGKLARELRICELMADRLPLNGGTTQMDAAVLRGAVHLRFGERELTTNEVVAVDLSAASRYHQLEIEGLLGYPALSDSALTVSYRDRYVRIEPLHKH